MPVSESPMLRLKEALISRTDYCRCKGKRNLAETIFGGVLCDIDGSLSKKSFRFMAHSCACLFTKQSKAMSMSLLAS